MPMAGKGMLLTSMDIDAADEAESNRWPGTFEGEFSSVTTSTTARASHFLVLTLFVCQLLAMEHRAL
jgi:hypothetical protein